MKKLIFSMLLFTATICLLNSCNNGQKATITIDGTVSEDIKDTAYFVYLSDSCFNMNFDVPVDTIYVKNKKFSYSSDVTDPTLIYLRAIFEDGTLAPAMVDFILVPNETAELKVGNGFYKADGSKFYHEWRQFDDFYEENVNSIKELSQQVAQAQYTPEFDSIFQIYQDKVKDLSSSIKNYLNSRENEEGAWIYSLFGGIISPLDTIPDVIKNGRFKPLIDTLAMNEIRYQEQYGEMERLAKQAQAETAEGMMFKDFECEYDGKIQKLSDYVGKGKYVLVDFWASWCGPCRQEVPNIIDVYNKYKGDNFEVIGVAVSDKPEDTQKAVEDLGIEYPQIFNSGDISRNVYGILGIPHIILFGPDGKIIKRDLRGSEIEKCVKTQLKK
ncbi:MAG: AhpC/TSA family protein [Bacteroidales bacterium]|nr:AhpC/TSA family protein [Bacteroidales bacterium]